MSATRRSAHSRRTTKRKLADPRYLRIALAALSQESDLPPLRGYT